MAQLDRIPEVKEVAQIAACVGREFEHGRLAAITEQPAARLAGAFDKLATAELVFHRGTPSEARYTFKHALVRDAAYESLLKSRCGKSCSASRLPTSAGTSRRPTDCSAISASPKTTRAQQKPATAARSTSPPATRPHYSSCAR